MKFVLTVLLFFIDDIKSKRDYNSNKRNSIKYFQQASGLIRPGIRNEDIEAKLSANPLGKPNLGLSKLLKKKDEERSNRRRYTEERESSTSLELKAWKVEFDQHWIEQKQKAIKKRLNASGDAVNIAAARPFAKPCGDPNEHDLPWGSCTLPSDCDAEYRIYRGDSFCGVTQFVCCSIQTTQYDLYQALDLSFVDTGSSTSGEKERQKVGPSQVKQNKRRRERIRRWKKRRKAKKKLVNKIKRLAYEIKKALNRAFLNATDDRKRRMIQLKKTIIAMKKKFWLDRKYAFDEFNVDIGEIVSSMKSKLNDIKKFNLQYLNNETYSEHLKKRNVTGMRSLTKNLTNSTNLKPLDLSQKTRRSGGDFNKRKIIKPKRTPMKYLEYDLEFRALYY